MCIGSYLDTTDADIIRYTRVMRAKARITIMAKAEGKTHEFQPKQYTSPVYGRRGSYASARRALAGMGRISCYLCGIKLTRKRDKPHSFTVDHKTPLSRGGEDRMSNFAACCLKCNNAKGNLTEAEYRAVIGRSNK